MASIVEIDPSKIMGGIGTLAMKLRTAITGVDPEKRGELEVLVAEIEGKVNLGQMAINQEEAKHPSLFVSGWRPFIGWICGIGLLYHYIIDRLISWVIVIWFAESKIVTPAFDIQDLLVILGGLLGLGTLRSAEKWKGVARTMWGRKKQ